MNMNAARGRPLPPHDVTIRLPRDWSGWSGNALRRHRDNIVCLILPLIGERR